MLLCWLSDAQQHQDAQQQNHHFQHSLQNNIVTIEGEALQKLKKLNLNDNNSPQKSSAPPLLSRQELRKESNLGEPHGDNKHSVADQEVQIANQQEQTDGINFNNNENIEPKELVADGTDFAQLASDESETSSDDTDGLSPTNNLPETNLQDTEPQVTNEAHKTENENQSHHATPEHIQSCEENLVATVRRLTLESNHEKEKVKRDSLELCQKEKHQLTLKINQQYTLDLSNLKQNLLQEFRFEEEDLEKKYKEQCQREKDQIKIEFLNGNHGIMAVHDVRTAVLEADTLDTFEKKAAESLPPLTEVPLSSDLESNNYQPPPSSSFSITVSFASQSCEENLANAIQKLAHQAATEKERIQKLAQEQCIQEKERITQALTQQYSLDLSNRKQQLVQEYKLEKQSLENKFIYQCEKEKDELKKELLQTTSTENLIFSSQQESSETNQTTIAESSEETVPQQTSEEQKLEGNEEIKIHVEENVAEINAAIIAPSISLNEVDSPQISESSHEEDVIHPEESSEIDESEDVYVEYTDDIENDNEEEQELNEIAETTNTRMKLSNFLSVVKDSLKKSIRIIFSKFSNFINNLFSIFLSR